MEKRNGATFARMIFAVTALLFLADPNIAQTDYLPNAVSCILFCISFYYLKEISDRIKNAYKTFIILSFLSVARYAGAYIVLKVTDTREAAILTLILTSAVTISESMLYIKAFNNVSDGISDVALNVGLPQLFTTERGTCLDKILKKTAVITFLIRATVSVLPELTALTLYGNYDGADLYSGIVIFRTMGSVVSSLSGVVFIAVALLFFLKTVKSREFCDGTDKVLKEKVLSNRPLFVSNTAKSYSFIMTLGAVLLTRLTIDGGNVIPQYIGALLIIVGFVRAVRYQRIIGYAGIGVTAVYGGAELWLLILEKNFSSLDYTVGSVRRVADAYNGYYTMSSVSLITQVLSLATVVFILIGIKSFIIDRKTGVSYTGDDDSIKKKKLSSLIKEYRKKSIVACVLWAISAVLYTVHYFLAPYLGNSFLSIETAAVAFRVLSVLDLFLIFKDLRHEEDIHIFKTSE